MALYDCFMYFDEDMLLDIRLNILNETVDKFVIAEATKTHSGKDKKLNFDMKNFLKFKDKINYLVIDDLPQNLSKYKKGWSESHLRDQYQRNSLSRGLVDCDENDLVMISDLDEIPNPDKISEFDKEKKYACFLQKNFHQKLNLLNTSIKEWPGTKICIKKYLKSPQWLRNIKIKEIPFWKFYKPQRPQILNDGGWHFNDLKTPEELSNKIKSYAHQEFNKDKFVDVRKISDRLKNRQDLFDRDYKFEIINIDKNYPKFLRENKIKYKNWIL